MFGSAAHWMGNRKKKRKKGREKRDGSTGHRPSLSPPHPMETQYHGVMLPFLRAWVLKNLQAGLLRTVWESGLPHHLDCCSVWILSSLSLFQYSFPASPIHWIWTLLPVHFSNPPAVSTPSPPFAPLSRLYLRHKEVSGPSKMSFIKPLVDM